MAAVNAQKREYTQLYQEHLNAVTPQQLREMSKEEILSIPDEYQTLENLAKAGIFDSKYGQVEVEDPLFQAGKEFARRNPIRR